MRDQIRWTETEACGCGIVTTLAETVSMPDGTFSVIIRDYGYRQDTSIAINDTDGYCTDSMYSMDLEALQRRLPFFEEDVRTNRHSHYCQV